MDRAAIIQGQTRAAEALIELIRTGRPPVDWAVSEKPDLFGMVPEGLGDVERYALMVRWAGVLGTELRSSSNAVDMWEGASSDPEHSGGRPVTRTWESLEIETVNNGVPVRLSETVALGTGARAHGSPPRAPSTDPLADGQLKAAKALAEVLKSPLPTARWGVYARGDEPSLLGTIRARRARASRADLTEWAGFLGTEVHYGREKRDFGQHRWGRVTGQVLGVRIQVRADVRAPSTLAGYWRSLSGAATS